MKIPAKVAGFILLITLLATTYHLLATNHPVFADEIEDLQKQIDGLNQKREQSVKATKPLEGQLGVLKRQLAQIQNSIQQISYKVTQKEKDLEIRTEKIAVQQVLLEQRVRSYYIRSFLTSPFLIILSSQGSADIFKELSYRLAATREDRKVIGSITEEMLDLVSQKERLEKDKVSLAFLQAQVDKNAQFFDGEVKKAKVYQSELSSQIASLTAKQQQIIAQRQASLNLPTSLGAGPLFCIDDRKLDPGFRPAFAFFTFGIPHRVGMNQYGAYGRANSGQSHEDILRAYFNDFGFETRANINIKVQGYGEVPLETYLLGIYEMPEGWPLEALKAQAIAARSYALAYTDNGSKEICTTQACQVYKNSPKTGAWKVAVEQTAGKTMISGGQVVTAWYASTAGGYTFTSGDVGWNNRGWTKRLRDTTGDVSGFADLLSKAYDKDSPCFYAAQGYRSEYSKSAWLKGDEVADIANVIQLVKKDSGVAGNIYQPDKPNPEGKETWDSSRVKSELRNRGGIPLNSVSDISVSADFGSGQSTTVTISSDAGPISFAAPEFKNYFNLRAPANLSIVGPLFSVEKK